MFRGFFVSWEFPSSQAFLYPEESLRILRETGHRKAPEGSGRKGGQILAEKGGNKHEVFIRQEAADNPGSERA